uniref:Uncharacterized protein n=1 Tax=Mastacembelus armatus TaxID=205130 RepID=A0A3Q3N3S9_9TELE
MFKTITRMLFGAEEETLEVIKSGEVVEEGWLVVTHQGRSDRHNSFWVLAHQVINTYSHFPVFLSSMLDPEPAVQSSSTTGRAISGYLPQAKAVAEVTQLTYIQKAKAWADRHHMSRKGIQRQNHVRYGVQQHSFHLQQPGHRNLSH